MLANETDEKPINIDQQEPHHDDDTTTTHNNEAKVDTGDSGIEKIKDSEDNTAPPDASNQQPTNQSSPEKRKEREFDNRRDYGRSNDRYYNNRYNNDRRSDYKRDYRRDDRYDSRREDRPHSRRDERGYSRNNDRSYYNRRDDRLDRNRSEKKPPQQENVYIPPFKLRKMQQETTDASSEEFQKLNWEALQKTLNGIVNKVNATNLADVIPEVFAENIVRGKGLLVKAIIKAQNSSNQFSNVYAALTAVINTRIPEIGELLLKRVVVQFLRAYKRNDRQKCISSCHFIAHLVNQQVASEILAGQALSLLLENATNDSVELAVTFVKECGKTLLEIAPKILTAVFEAFRNILHEGKIDRRVQYMIETLFNIRKLEFKDYPSIKEELDLVEDDDRIIHDSIELSSDLDTEDHLDNFQYDPNFEENEARYKEIKEEILGEGEEEEEETKPAEFAQEIQTQSTSEAAPESSTSSTTTTKPTLLDPKTKTDEESTALKRKIYLTIMSSLTFDDCAHKLLKSGLAKDHDMEVCSMIVECCSQERSYLDFYGSLGERFCRLSDNFRIDFEECFRLQYSILHRYETGRLRNIAKFFAHLLVADAISWSIFVNVKLTETDTTSYSRIFLKVLFQELKSKLGTENIKQRLLNDEEHQQYYVGLFPKDNPKVVRFAINFWILIELPQLAEGLKSYLKEMATKATESSSSESESEESDSSESSSDTSSDDEE
ncbi:hypothetical protein C9374_009696 [Naegleria lovaniensis]|uniref:MI domain-containing protein n=1 Tax=Naegleria lovaniensis TaxID=51637 RepID=A0AA88GYW0_NAELO|nr:uncharacterized protein C9374_009696 [Naegleria lovaniensis]KAG2393119.1 hypothetical protein C9374_009696 [Naegleria lovaniensis]